MSKFFFLLLSIPILLSCSKEKNSEKKVEGDTANVVFSDTSDVYDVISYLYDIDKDEKPDSIILQNTELYRGDPQIFTILKIKTAAGKLYQFELDGAKIDTAAIRNYPNTIQSDMLYIPDINGSTDYLFIWDYQYPDCTAIITVFSLKNGIKMAYLDNFYIKEFKDLTNDGFPELIGKKECEQYVEYKTVANEDIYMYLPFTVLQLSDTILSDSSLTKKYNTDNYVFYGFEPSDKIMVAYPRNGQKPYVYEPATFRKK